MSPTLKGIVIEEDCSERNQLFNTIYTTTNLAYAIATVIVGVVADKWGMVWARSLGAVCNLVGLCLITLIMTDRSFENYLWVAWPALGVG